MAERFPRESPPDTINETLENFAHAHHLNVHQVKKIIYHILTDQNLFATLLGNDKDNAPHVKLTRSRWREIQRQVKTKIPLPLEIRSGSSPSTFLSMELDEDSDDSEYFPPPTPLADRIAQQEFEDMWCHEDPTFDFPVNSSFGNGEYGRFIYDTFIHYKPYDEQDIHDQDYNVMEDLQHVEKEDKLEYRYDKTTRISKKEMLDLWKELEINVEGNVLNLDPPLPTPKKRTSDKGSEPKQAKRKVNLVTSLESAIDTAIENEPQEVQPCTSGNLIEVEIQPDISIGETASVEVKVPPIMQKPLRINKVEWKIMKEQAELLIQSLTQTCLLTAGEDSDEGVECFNHSARKINELVFLARSENILFKNTPVEEACDLVWNYKEKVDMFVNIPDFHYTNRSVDDEYHLPHCVRLAISTSTVFKYPKLLSLKRAPSTKKSYFSTGEQALLALGLKYFDRVPLGRRGSEEGKYQYICRTLLPYRTPVQIRVHIKNAKQSPVTSRTSVGRHLMAAVSSSWNPDNAAFFQFMRVDDLPIDWKKELQPLWLQELANCRIYKKFADCILAAFCVCDNCLVPVSDLNTLGTVNFFKSVIMSLEKEKSLPAHRVVCDKAERFLLFKRITQSFPDILQSLG